MFGITRYTDVFLLSFLMAAFTQIKTVKIGHQVELLLAPNRKRKEELNDLKNIFSQCCFPPKLCFKYELFFKSVKAKVSLDYHYRLGSKHFRKPLHKQQI